MEVITNNYMPGDPRLVEQLVYELKSQGIFDQFRKECIADVDTKPAYQNLRQRVEGSVTTFLKQQTWRPDMNKNQVREQLRKNIYESGYLDTGVERIVDQVVNPKINTIFLPQVEDVVYRYLGIEKPNRLEVKKGLKIDVTDLLPTDLEAISPESDHTKDDSLNFNDSLNSDTKMEEDESPPFEPIDGQSSNIHHEENSVDSHLSGFSGLQSHDSNLCMDPKVCQMELSNQDSQVSQNSSESRLSIITSEDNTKMEIREDSDSKLLKSSDSNSQMEIYPLKPQTTLDVVKSEVEKVDESDSSSDNNVFDEKNIKKREDEKEADKINDVKKKVVDEKQSEDKKYNDRKLDDKKSKSSDKYNYKDKKDDKYRKNSGNSSRDKEKSSSKYSSSSSSKDKTKNKDKKDSRNNCSSSKDKDKQEKDSYKNERDKDKIKNEKDKCERERDRDRKDKDKSEKDKVDKSKLVKEKEKSVKDKDKGKSCNSSSSSSSSKHNNNKEKDKSSTSVKSDSSKKDKEKSRSSSSSSSKDNKSKSSYSDSKSKSSSSDKHKKDDKSSVKHSNSSSSSKKDKDKKKNSKKDDDHYSSKDKKNDRRSTDRDSNDGRSSKPGQINSFPEGQSSQTQKSNQESSNSNSGSGSGDSGNSDQNEHINKSPFKVTEHSDNKEPPITYLDTQKFKYTKPKFASNFQEARKLMKIRKQLAKLERHNQLSLAQIEVPTEITIVNGINCAENDSDGEQRNVENIKEIEDFFEQSKTPEVNEGGICAKDKSLFLQSRELSKENWEALEARLAQEMSNINCNSYESYDDYDYGGYNSAGVSPIKTSLDASEKCATEENVEKIVDSESNQSQQREVEDVTEKCILPQIHTESKWEEGSNNVIEEIGKNNALSILSDVESLSLKDNSETTENYSEEGMTDVQEGVTENKPTDTGESEVFKTDLDEGVTKMAVDTEDKVNNVDFTLHSDSDSSEPCIYLEPLSPRLDKNLQFLYKYIETLEQDVKHSLKTFQNNFVPLKERYRKRKLVENVDLRNNNNKAHYEQTTDIRKRRRSLAPNANSVISKANKEKLCNNSDISPNDSFSLPLSPAESDKSNDKKEEELPKTKQKRESMGKYIKARNQRYSSEDLYKPRPIFISSRRSRCAKNMGK